jgi:TPR repeat protein
MDVISIAAATTLTEWSERTFWRRFTEGSIERISKNGKAVIRFDAIAGHVCIPLDDEDKSLFQQADAGDAAAQTDIALIFLTYKKPKGALAWLNLAVKQDDANAMYLLARCYIDGYGTERDENLGLMWLSKAACRGSRLAKETMQLMLARVCLPA